MATRQLAFANQEKENRFDGWRLGEAVDICVIVSLIGTGSGGMDDTRGEASLFEKKCRRPTFRYLLFVNFFARYLINDC